MDLEKIIVKGLIYYKIDPNEDTLQNLKFYVRELCKWNKRMNLSGIKDAEGIVTQLIYDAFFLSVFLKDCNNIMDLGSGAGILGIPINILYPWIHIFSVDKSLRKIQFQRHIKRLLSLSHLSPIHSRVELLEPLSVDSFVVKGFGTIGEILDKAGLHLKKGGSAYILKGETQGPIEYRGYRLECDRKYVLPENKKVYRLFIYRKD